MGYVEEIGLYDEEKHRETVYVLLKVLFSCKVPISAEPHSLSFFLSHLFLLSLFLFFCLSFVLLVCPPALFSLSLSLRQVGLWTHLDFNIEYNGDSVIFANVSVKDVKPVPLEEGAGAAVGGVGVGGGSVTVTHTYSVHWFESPLPHARRAERLRDYSFFPKTLEIHWLSIINSLVLVVLLLGFVIIILMRVLKNDFARLA